MAALLGLVMTSWHLWLWRDSTTNDETASAWLLLWPGGRTCRSGVACSGPGRRPDLGPVLLVVVHKGDGLVLLLNAIHADAHGAPNHNGE